ncbi:MAG TPA: hypothetical protein VKE88_03450, partial [Candidatus Nanoarchaeia archaeon]|nr:hypothetical protein [Candidatus Nanoarchaeia archaeon]
MSKPQKLIAEVQKLRQMGFERIVAANPNVLIRKEKELKEVLHSIQEKELSATGNDLDNLAQLQMRVESDLADLQKVLKEKTSSNNLHGIEKEVLSFSRAMQQIKEQEGDTLKNLKKELPDVYDKVMKRWTALDSLLQGTSIIDPDEDVQHKKAKIKAQMVVLLHRIKQELE